MTDIKENTSGQGLSLNKIYNMDCIEGMKLIPDGSIDAIITDPPYEIGFMGKGWDDTGIANNVDMWKECLRVLKPGGHLLSFAATRTYHRMASAIEDAGFEVRDMIEWVYGSGFPKSLNIGKAVDKLQGKEPIIVGKRTDGRYGSKFQDGNNQFVNAENNQRKEVDSKIGLITKPATPEGEQWEGWGTALKPAHEPICMARKPLSEKTVVENVLKYGTGGINIDESRVDFTSEEDLKSASFGSRTKNPMPGGGSTNGNDVWEKDIPANPLGRFPANLIHNNSEEVRECFPETGKGNWGGVYNYAGREYDNKDTSMFNGDKPQAPSNFNDSGNASRFFKSIIYQAKASKSERNKGTQDYLVFNITLGGENMELDELQKNDMLEKIRKWCIDWFGKKGIDKSQIDFKSTIKIETKKITILVILNFLVHLNIKEYTVDAIETKNENDENLVENVENTSPLKQIITKELTEYLHDVSNVVFKMPVKINVSGNQNNFHSTVKPIALMEYLIKMVTKEGGTVLDPFVGSGTTLVAAKKNGYNYIGFELTEEYIPIIEVRLNAIKEENTLF